MAHGEPTAIRRFTDQQELRVLSSLALSVQPRGDHARGVDDEQVARGNQRGEIAELQMARRPARAVEYEQPARRAIGERMLSDLFRRKVVVEIGESVRVGWTRAGGP